MIKSSIAVYRNAYLGLSDATWWLAFVMFVNRAGTMVLPFLTVYLRQEMHYSIAEAGWEVGFFGIGAILGNFIGGKLTDKIGFFMSILEFVFEWTAVYCFGSNENILANWLLHVYYWHCR